MTDLGAGASAVPEYAIITAAYNASKTLEESVDSVMAQTFRDWEMVIVDDGSTDRTLEIAERLAREDLRVRVISQPNEGTAAARNAGVGSSTGRWLCMLDADDLLLPTFLERMSAFRDEHPGYDIYSPITTMLLRDGGRVPLFAGSEWAKVRSVTVIDQMQESSIAQVSIMKRGVFDRVSGYRGVYSEDYDFWLRALILGARQLQNPEPLWLYRRQEGSKTTALVREAESILGVLSDARDMPQLTAEERAACDRAVAAARARIDRRRLEEALLRGDYRGTRGQYLRLHRTFPNRRKYLLGLLLMMASPALYGRVKRQRMR